MNDVGAVLMAIGGVVGFVVLAILLIPWIAAVTQKPFERTVGRYWDWVIRKTNQ